MPTTETSAAAAGRQAPLAPAVFDLLGQARRGIVAAGTAARPHERYAAAHLAALRAAAAVLAARARPLDMRTRSRGPRNAWALLSDVAPELTEWAAFFAAGAAKRAAAEAGLTRMVSAREADDLVRDAEKFLAVIETTLGVPHQRLLAVG
jgi:hypothetical protein